MTIWDDCLETNFTKPLSLIEKFEETKTYQLCKSWMIDFDEEKQVYYSIDPIFMSSVTAINAAWMMFQELNK